MLTAGQINLYNVLLQPTPFVIAMESTYFQFNTKWKKLCLWSERAEKILFRLINPVVVAVGGRGHFSVSATMSTASLLCFPFRLGRVRITIFHLLVSCSLVCSLGWAALLLRLMAGARQNPTDTNLSQGNGS